MLASIDFILPYMNVYTALLGLTVSLVLVYWRCKTERDGIPPGPPFLPILGNLLDTRGEYVYYIHKYFAKLKEKYGSVFRIYFGSQLMIVLNDFESINEAFVKQKDIFTSRPSEKLWGIKEQGKLGHGVFWTNGQRWKSNRRLAAKALRDMGVGQLGIEEKILKEAEYVMESFPLDEPFIIKPYLSRATINIIGTIVFGSRWDYSDPELIDLVDLYREGFKSESFFSPIQEFPSLRFLPSLAHTIEGVSKFFSSIQELIDERVKSHEKTFNLENSRDFIDVVLAEIGKDPEVDRVSLKGTIRDFVLAGSETTASTMDWIFLYMIRNPEILKKCQTEVDDVVGSSRKVRYSDRPNLPYIEATLLEAQRIGSVGPFTPPHTAVRDTNIKGYVIPAGSLIVANIHSCHMDPAVWPDPFKFNPGRFLDEHGKLKKLPSAFMPFSTGPRSCPGETLAKMEIFLFFTSIIQRYNITKAYPDDRPSTDGFVTMTRTTPSHKLRVFLRTANRISP